MRILVGALRDRGLKNGFPHKATEREIKVQLWESELNGHEAPCPIQKHTSRSAQIDTKSSTHLPKNWGLFHLLVALSFATLGASF